MHSIIIVMFGCRLCSKINFAVTLPILANFAAVLDKKSAVVSLMGIIKLKNLIKILSLLALELS